MKNLTTKTIRLSVAIFLMLGLVLSCAEDFLEVDSNEKTDVSITAENAPELVNAAYASFLEWQMSSFSWIGITSITSDDADKGSDPGDTGGDKVDLDGLTFNSTTVSFDEVWDAHYGGIQRANQAITRIGSFEMEATLKTGLLGESKFLRALMYFRLVKSFGCVPLLEGSPDISSTDILK